MGLLDELKKQAADARLNHESDAERQQKLEQNYQQIIRPRVLAITRYLHEMAEQLQMVKLDIPVIYNLPGIGPAELQQGLFKINVDHADQPKKISISLECMAAESATYPIYSNTEVNETRDILEKNGVQYTEWAIRDQDNRVCGANFEGRLKIKVRLLLQVSVEHNRIVMVSSNFEGLGMKKMTFGMEQISDDWMDELGRYLLRREATLGSLDIAEHQKEFIKTQLTNYEMERQKELEAARQAANEMEKPKEDKLLSGLRKTLNKPLW